MKPQIIRIVACLALCLATLSAIAAPIELRLKDGTRWRGEVSDVVKLKYLESGTPIEFQGTILDQAGLYLTVEGKELGKTVKKVIFKSDIVSISTVEKGTGGSKSDDSSPAAPQPGGNPGSTATTDNGSANQSDGKSSGRKQPEKRGVFVLPIKGTVGGEVRSKEIEMLADKLDKEYGDGQIIVLLIDSPGGSLLEMERSHDALTRIKQRHRLVAWIQKAISAACAIAIHCDEIYFMTEGTAGAMTGWNPGTGQSLKDEELARWMKEAGDWAEVGGRSRWIAESMIHAPILLSYDKDPVTGKVTWHNDLSGQYIMSRDDENLTFTASTAMHSGFADGVADTPEDMAKLLNLPEWYEISSYGRDITKEWYETCKRAEEELPKLAKQYEYKGTGSGDPYVVLGTRIRILEDLIRWSERAPGPYMMKGLPPKGQLERDVAQLRKQIADMRRAERNRSK